MNQTKPSIMRRSHSTILGYLLNSTIPQILRVLGLASLVASCTSSSFLPKGASGDQQTAVFGSGSDLDGELGCSLDQVPRVFQGADSKAANTLFNLTPCQRRTMMVLAESSSVPADDRRTEVAQSAIKTQFKYVKIRSTKISLKVNEFDGKKWRLVSDSSKIDMILTQGLVFRKNEFVYVPVNQETTTYHPLLKQLLDDGDAFAVLPDQIPQETRSKVTIATMSRSQWVLKKNSDALYTIKVGSDTVNRKSQPHKLTDVYEDLHDLEVISKTTSIASLVKQVGIIYMPDRYSIMIESPRTDFKRLPPYALAIREYESLLKDQERFYISYHRLFQAKPNRWGKIQVPVHWDRTIEYSSEDFDRILAQLNDGMAKAVAIHNANGYLTRDFHGQNILVGLPLARHIRAKLVIRDVTDIYETNFDHKISCYPCLTQVKSDFWPEKTKQLIDETYNLAYSAMMLKLKFMESSIPWGQVTRKTSVPMVWPTLIENQKDSYWNEVRRIRRADSCFP